MHLSRTKGPTSHVSRIPSDQAQCKNPHIKSGPSSPPKEEEEAPHGIRGSTNPHMRHLTPRITLPALLVNMHKHNLG
jgi:hypothetical protein